MPDSKPTGEFSSAPAPIADVVYEFEKALRAGKKPDIEAFLQGDGPDRWHLLIELVHSELELRLRAREAVQLSDYLERFPGLIHFPNELAAVLETEVKLRTQHGDGPTMKDYEQRYPALSSRVRDVFRKIGAAPPEVPGYEVIDRIASGGMGVVYRARQLLLKREVALKVIRRDRLAGGTAGDRFKKRFRREAQAVGAVNHPNVVQVYETGESDGDLFIAMELVDGPSLQARIESGGVLEPFDAAELVEAVARAVHAVHARDIVHRDLKPDNILLASNGTPKVADFGLARPAEVTDGNTQAGVFVGTPEYSSPEQAALTGEDPTPRTDVYGLGAVLYAALTGHPPFPRAQDVLTTLERVRNQSVASIRAIRPDVPRDVETICLKCLEKEPKNRYATAEALADDLRRWMDGEPVLARPVGRAERTWKWAKRKPTAAAALVLTGLTIVLTALGGGAAWLWQRAEDARGTAVEERTKADEQRGIAVEQKGKADDARREAEQAKGETEIALKGEKKARGEADALAADLDKLNYARTVDLAHQEYLMNRIAQARRLLDSCRPELRGWEWHYVRRLCYPDLYTIPTSDFVAEFSPDGTRLLSVSAAGTGTVWDAATGAKVCECKSPPPMFYLFAGFTPDGTHVVLHTKRDPTGRNLGNSLGVAGVWVFDAKSGAEVVNFTNTPNAGDKLAEAKDQVLVECSPRCNRILTRGSDGEAKLWNAAGAKLLATIPATKADGLFKAWFAPDGARVATMEGLSGTLRIWDTENGRKLGELFGLGFGIDGVWFSANGKAIAVKDNKGTHVAVAPSWRKSRVFAGSEKYASARISPDGNRIAFVGEKGVISSIWRTGEEAEAIMEGEPDRRIWDVSPDVSRAVRSVPGNGVEVWDLKADEEIATCSVAAKLQSVRFAANGSRLLTEARVFDHAGPRSAVVQAWDADRGNELLAIPTSWAPVPKSARPNTWIDRRPTGGDFVALTPDGDRLVIASETGAVGVWDMRSGGQLVARKGLPIRRNQSIVSFGAIILAQPGGVMYSNVPGFSVVVPEALDPGRLVVSPDGNRIVTTLKDGGFSVWDARFAGAARLFAKPPAATGFQPVFNPDGVRAVNVPLPDGTRGLRLVTVGDSAVSVIDAASGKPPVTLTPDSGLKFWAADLSPDGARVATWEAWKTGDYVRVRDALTGKEIASAKLDLMYPPLGARFSPDGKFLITAYPPLITRELKEGEKRPPGRVIVWDAATCKQVSAFDATVHEYEEIAFGLQEGSPRLLLGSARESSPVVVYDPLTGTKICELDVGAKLESSPRFPAFNADCSRVVGVRGNDGAIAVWDTATGKQQVQVKDPEGSVRMVRFSTDGTRLVSAGPGSTARVWDATTGKLLATLTGHAGAVQWAEFSPDGTRIITASDDTTVRIWDAKSGHPLISLSGHTEPVQKASFAPGGLQIISVSKGEVRLWETGPPNR